LNYEGSSEFRFVARHGATAGWRSGVAAAVSAGGQPRN
jgi:hypothetical protein